MTKAKTLATLVSTNNPLADGTLSVGNVTGLQMEFDTKQAALVSGTSSTVNYRQENFLAFPSWMVTLRN